MPRVRVKSRLKKMIVRTPQRRSNEGRRESPAAAGPLVIFQDNDPADSSHHFLCTYQCRQMVKSDFIDALSNSENQVSGYKSKLEALHDNFCKVEQELAAAKGREQALQEQLLKEVHDSHERLTKQLQSYNELEGYV